MVSCAQGVKSAARVKTQMDPSGENGAKTEICLHVSVLFSRGEIQDEFLASELDYSSESLNPKQPLEILSGH